MDETWPIILLVLGWLANEATQRVRLEDARRAELNRAITNLFEIHHHLRTTELLLNHLAPKAGLSATDLGNYIRPFLLQQWLPRSVLTNYQQAIDALASHDPLLAFQLMGKQRLPEIMLFQQNWQAQMPTAKVTEQELAAMRQFATGLSEFVAKDGLKVLEESIRTMAWHSSKLLWWRCRRQFNSSAAIADLEKMPEFAAFTKQLAEVVDQINAAQKAAGAKA